MSQKCQQATSESLGETAPIQVEPNRVGSVSYPSYCITCPQRRGAPGLFPVAMHEYPDAVVAR
jgi:hypothetical protein